MKSRSVLTVAALALALLASACAPVFEAGQPVALSSVRPGDAASQMSSVQVSNVR